VTISGLGRNAREDATEGRRGVWSDRHVKFQRRISWFAHADVMHTWRQIKMLKMSIEIVDGTCIRAIDVHLRILRLDFSRSPPVSIADDPLYESA
jgi:hypothetical protein